MKNYITLELAKNYGFEWTKYATDRMNEQIKELENFKDLCTIIPMVNYSEYDDKKHFEHITVFIDFKGVLLRPYKRYNEKSFEFSLAESLYVPSFNHNLEAPQKVGKPTEKKLLAWVEYLQNVELLKIEKINERKNKETEFLDKIKNSGLKVSHQSNDGKRGYIITEFFEFSFEILNDGYINQSIRLTKSGTIDTFLELIK